MMAKAPEMLSASDPDNPEMHRTDSVDYGIVLEGELTLELDDGRTTVVTPGCCIVQGGTNHAWRNLTDKPVRMAFVLMGCTREG
jgi:quercetin dioxygenase-like cupin family protein